MPNIINTELAGLTVHIQGEKVVFDKDGKAKIEKEKAYRAALELHNFYPDEAVEPTGEEEGDKAPEAEEPKDEAPKDKTEKPVEEPVADKPEEDAEAPKETPKAPAKKTATKK